MEGDLKKTINELKEMTSDPRSTIFDFYDNNENYPSEPRMRLLYVVSQFQSRFKKKIRSNATFIREICSKKDLPEKELTCWKLKDLYSFLREYRSGLVKYLQDLAKKSTKESNKTNINDFITLLTTVNFKTNELGDILSDNFYKPVSISYLVDSLDVILDFKTDLENCEEEFDSIFDKGVINSLLEYIQIVYYNYIVFEKNMIIEAIANSIYTLMNRENRDTNNKISDSQKFVLL